MKLKEFLDKRERKIVYLKDAIKGIKTLVAQQAEDEALWAIYENINTAYIQQELRKLHYCIEHIDIGD